MILLETAMREEGFNIPDLLSLDKVLEDYPISYNEKFCYVRTGIGKTNTALFTQMCIDKFPIDRVINFGMAGAMSPNLEWGDTVFPNIVFQHDFNCTGMGFEMGEVPFQDISIFEPSKEMLDKSRSVFKDIKECKYLLTGDSFVMEAIPGYEDSVCDMEGYSVARTCHINKIPFAFFKLVSDHCNSHSDTNFKDALDKLSLPFQEKMAEFVKSLI